MFQTNSFKYCIELANPVEKSVLTGIENKGQIVSDFQLVLYATIGFPANSFLPVSLDRIPETTHRANSDSIPLEIVVDVVDSYSPSINFRCFSKNPT